VCAFALAAGLSSRAHADPKPVVSTKVPEHAVGASFGYDPTFVLGLSYGHGWRHLLGQHDARLDVTAQAPVVLIPTGLNWEAGLGVTGLFFVRERFRIAAHAHTGLATSKSVLGNKLAWLVQLAVRPGYYDERGHFAADISYRTALATRVWHSAVVEDSFDDRYPEGSYAALAETGPYDGWYGLRAHRIRAGFTGGVQAGIIAFYVGAGFQYIPQPPGIVMNAPLGTFPFYANLGLDFRWPRR
jgi:hypothetical protein